MSVTELPKGIYELPHYGSSAELPTYPRVARLPRAANSPNANDVLQSNVTMLLEAYDEKTCDTEYWQDQSERLRNRESMDALVAAIQNEIDRINYEWNFSNSYSDDELLKRGYAIDALLEQLDLELACNDDVEENNEINDFKQKISSRLHGMFGTTCGSVANNIGKALEVRPKKAVIGVVATCAIAGTVIPSAAAAEPTVKAVNMQQSVHDGVGSHKNHNADNDTKSQYRQRINQYAQALVDLQNNDGVGGNNIQNIHSKIHGYEATQWAKWAVDASDKYGGNIITAGFLLADLKQESQFNPGASSPVGAQGACQFMPTTWQGRGARGNPFNPWDCIPAQARYLEYIYSGFVAPKFGNSISAETARRLTLAGYNAGENLIRTNGMGILNMTDPGYANYVEHYLSKIATSLDRQGKIPAPRKEIKSHPKPSHKRSRAPAAPSLQDVLSRPVALTSADLSFDAPLSLTGNDVVKTEPADNPFTIPPISVPENTAPTPSTPSSSPAPAPSPEPAPNKTMPPDPLENVSSTNDSKNRLTDPAASIFENTFHVPAGGIGHDVYYTYQGSDMNIDNINGDVACSLAVAAMVVSSLQHDPNISISDLHQGSITSGSYSDRSGALYPYGGRWTTYLHDTYGLTTNTILDQNAHSHTTDATMDSVDEALANGEMLVVHSSNYSAYSIKYKTHSGHFFVLYGKADGKYYVANPGNRGDTGHGFTKAEIMDWADGFYAYGNPGYADTPKTPAPKPAPADPAQLVALLQVPVPAETVPTPPASTPPPVETAPSPTTPPASTPPIIEPSPSNPAPTSPEPTPPAPTTPTTPETPPSAPTNPPENPQPPSPVIPPIQVQPGDTEPSAPPTPPPAEAPAPGHSQNPQPAPNPAPAPQPAPAPSPKPAPKNKPKSNPTHSSPEKKSKPKQSGMSPEQAKAICSEAGATYMGDAKGYKNGQETPIYVCKLPPDMGSFPVNVEIASGVVKAVRELRAQGVSVDVISGYRSPSFQTKLRHDYNCDNPNGPGNAGCTHPVAVPGYSNHQMGKAVDIKSPAGYFGIVRDVFKKYGLYNGVPNDSNHFSADGN